MEIDILSLFPDYFASPLQATILGRAIKQGALSVRSRDIREFGLGKWKQVDDSPYNGEGMLLMAEPVVQAIRSIRRKKSKVIYLSPQGQLLSAKKSRELASCSHLVLLCGHYEGIDERALTAEVDEEISIGDYVLTNGCAAALVLVDALARFIPGILGNQESAEYDSLENGLLEGPQYTRPRVFEGESVPEVLLCGDHQKIADWRKQVSLERTRERRPDLYLQYFYGNSACLSTQEDLPRIEVVSPKTFSVVLEVQDLRKAKKFYSRMFGKECWDGDKLFLLGKTSLYLQQTKETRGPTTVFIELETDHDFVRFLKRWEMLGGELGEQGTGGFPLRQVFDLDGHIWVVSCVQK
ncbi:tRNA (guanosine(37)-N1)-methyltransferase TrmD [Chlamydia trachomatis]|uniref:tRNA (guanine-N(1)-)-methyltransferase n=2 Tax=Chlamydia trachomatis TaxID=813 RepID=TRMD_CHLT2|nr:tRNA (guanosine(37)-N1)-methyltransferase TrmD [Chlamydia trachomatis]B0B9D4.1 RecName: Full=tRNA (guanine-N(1)-)-methyltransferase; AltName: Full=M1G-methyltransferase; AltName: Full=tRNA [GM37] methyltransferase [Chlamydia trachomatis 434/Bu]B0BB13.1 RecName: Full=tRNA (guanine-N(1)-)-methyltransferase; AltName: Full=M1G-methyltransferase; AltName: Full=tRNA [GM37] methyltransferase [Chlamydia trachomatis L2b/UCH-1/proctitis]AEJ77595.1 tRNA (guanine-N1)-methyltransferase [Chlamydia trachoma